MANESSFALVSEVFPPPFEGLVSPPKLKVKPWGWLVLLLEFWPQMSRGSQKLKQLFGIWAFIFVFTVSAPCVASQDAQTTRRTHDFAVLTPWGGGQVC